MRLDLTVPRNLTFVQIWCFRLVIDADTVPIVLPFVHSGMQDIMPIGTKFPNIGKRVMVSNTITTFVSMSYISLQFG